MSDQILQNGDFDINGLAYNRPKDMEWQVHRTIGEKLNKIAKSAGKKWGLEPRDSELYLTKTGGSLFIEYKPGGKWMHATWKHPFPFPIGISRTKQKGNLKNKLIRFTTPSVPEMYATKTKTKKRKSKKTRQP